MPWLGATALIGVYSVILSFVAEEGPVERPATLRYGSLAVGGAFAVAAFLLPRRATADGVISAHMLREPEMHSVSAQLGLSHDTYHFLLGIPKPAQRLVGLIDTYRSAYVLGLALSAGVALTGFVLGCVTKNMLESAPFLVSAFALNGWHYPRLAALLDRGRKLDRPSKEVVALERTIEQIQDGTKASKPGVRASQRPPPRATKP